MGRRSLPLFHHGGLHALRTPSPWLTADDVEPSKMFKIVINDVEALDGSISIDFKYTADYPNVPPEFSVQPTMKLTNDQKDGMKDAMNESAEAGEVMVYTMISAAKEYLEEMFAAPVVETKKKVATETLTQEQRGTPVTRENFEVSGLEHIDGIEREAGGDREERRGSGRGGRGMGIT